MFALTALGVTVVEFFPKGAGVASSEQGPEEYALEYTLEELLGRRERERGAFERGSEARLEVVGREAEKQEAKAHTRRSVSGASRGQWTVCGLGRLEFGARVEQVGEGASLECVRLLNDYEHH